jgi:hypothetical protein
MNDSDNEEQGYDDLFNLPICNTSQHLLNQTAHIYKTRGLSSMRNYIDYSDQGMCGDTDHLQHQYKSEAPVYYNPMMLKMWYSGGGSAGK